MRYQYLTMYFVGLASPNVRDGKRGKRPPGQMNSSSSSSSSPKCEAQSISRELCSCNKSTIPSKDSGSCRRRCVIPGSGRRMEKSRSSSPLYQEKGRPRLSKFTSLPLVRIAWSLSRAASRPCPLLGMGPPRGGR